MNEQTSKERVLSVYPGVSACGPTGPNGWCQIMSMTPFGGRALSNRHQYEDDAWDDAASRLTEAKLPSSPAGGGEEVCPKTGEPHSYGIHDPGGEWQCWACGKLRPLAVPDPLGDISGPKGSGGAAPEAAVKVVDEIMASLGIQSPSVEEVLEELADGSAYGENSSFIRDFSKTTLRYIASLKSAAPIAPAAQELVQELMKPVLPVPLTEVELNRLFIREERRVIFGEYTAADFRHAISGHGPLAGEWADKPHRLVYDLLRVIDTYHARTERKEGEAKHG